jgi:cytokinin dehydrogenase
MAREAALLAAKAAGVSCYADAATRAAAERDFGGITSGECLLWAEPTSAWACERFLGELSRRGIGCTLRGAGYSQSGQSVASGTVTLSTRRLDWLGPVDVERGQVSVGSGVTLRQLLSHLEEHSVVPPVLPLNLDMTVGGLLSAGGLGPTSHSYGPVIANVASLDVVTERGGLRNCSRETEGALFDAVRGGLGRAGLIVGATLRVVPAPRRVLVSSYLYSDIGRWLSDQSLVTAADPRIHVEGYAWATAKGSRPTPTGPSPFTHWMFGLTVSVGDDVPPEVLKNLLPSLRPTHTYEPYSLDGAAFFHRCEPRFAAMIRDGHWGQAHPWFETIIPFEGCEDAVMRILENLPQAMGDGHRFTVLDTRNCPGHFGAPRKVRNMAIGVLPMSVIPSQLDLTLSSIDRLNRITLDSGGRRYLSGWLGKSPADYLSEHFRNAGSAPGESGSSFFRSAMSEKPRSH